ncbi:MAG TPA: VOC family protein [Acidimicrobiales bacterium]|nr:MAG: hypothetical protein B7Z69_04405 [Actinobacteria bacterium 21-73-9]HQU26706.1 VOC family protein [Acidimicrobiales bacterium]
MADTPSARAVTMLYVADVARARDFYRDVLGREPTMDAGSYAEFAWGNVVLGLRARDNALRQFAERVAPSSGRVDQQITVEVDDPDALLARARAHGAELVQPPTDQPWGMRSAAFLDPDGHLVEV